MRARDHDPLVLVASRERRGGVGARTRRMRRAPYHGGGHVGGEEVVARSSASPSRCDGERKGREPPSEEDLCMRRRRRSVTIIPAASACSMSSINSTKVPVLPTRRSLATLSFALAPTSPAPSLSLLSFLLLFRYLRLFCAVRYTLRGIQSPNSRSLTEGSSRPPRSPGSAAASCVVLIPSAMCVWALVLCGSGDAAHVLIDVLIDDCRFGRCETPAGKTFYHKLNIHLSVLWRFAASSQGKCPQERSGSCQLLDFD